MSKKSGISLKSFYIFNSECGPKEGEEEKKILFYYPADVNIDTKIKDVGLCEAIIKFTNSFTNDDSCHSLHTQKTSQIYYQPEKDFWMILTVNVPFETKTKDRGEYNEYKGDEVHDSIFQAVLKQSYKMFRLFMGTFQLNFIGEDLDVQRTNLISKLEHFYSRYMLTLKLKNSDILDVFSSIQYLPLNQLLFLRVFNFINMIESTFPSIKNSIFLYNEQVVWSGINASNLFSIYEYLIGTLFPKTSQTELQGGSIPKSYSMTTSHYGSFVTGPESYENCIKVPKVYIYNEDGHQTYYFVVYRALSATLCLFVEDKEPINDDWFQELHTFIGPQLTSIASEIGETFLSESTSQNLNINGISLDQTGGPKFLFFNELNLKHEGTVHLDHRKYRNSTIPVEVMNLIADLFNEKNSNNTNEESVIKTLNDFWIVKKSSNSRHFFVIINKSSTLLEVTDEAKKMYDQHIKNIFFDKQ